MEVKNNIQAFKDIVTNMSNIYEAKNHDYGDSFFDSLDDEGIVAARVRLSDKWNRFKVLSKGADIKVKDESIKDTLLDMANYCVMTLIWLNKNGN